MKTITIIILLLLTLSAENTRIEKKQDILYTLKITSNKSNEKYVTSITPPKGSDFELLDRAFPLQVMASKDFNADKKQDVMLNLGGCGSGGCVYAIFLKQHTNQYRLAYIEYLHMPEFEKTKNGQWIIKSFEGFRTDEPDEYAVEIYKFNKTKYIYELDTTYVEKMKK